MMAAITPGQCRQNEPSGRSGRFIRDADSFPKVLFVLSDEVSAKSFFKVDSDLLVLADLKQDPVCTDLLEKPAQPRHRSPVN